MLTTPTTVFFKRFLLSGFWILGMCSLGNGNPVNAAVCQDELKVAADSSNQFAIELHKQLANEAGNVFYSPASISAALGMTYAGAEGATKSEMEKVLRIPENQETWIKSTGTLSQTFNKKLDGFEIRLANRLWGQKDFAFHPQFLDNLSRVWNAPLGSVDYLREPEVVRGQINDWVESQTNGRIENLLPMGVITEDTRLVLTNAIYLKADWATQFNQESTNESPFFVSDGKSVQVPLMFQKGSFRYLENDRLQMLVLPYKAGDMSMEILLPRENQSLTELEKSLSPDLLKEWNESSREREVQVYLPRFKMTSSMQMKSVLSEMGMPRAFSGAAEFGGISSQEELAISEVIHKAFIEVDETGTEAAAATGVIVVTKSAMPLKPIEFRADRPFLILIRHQPSGLILFIGRLANPQA